MWGEGDEWRWENRKGCPHGKEPEEVTSYKCYSVSDPTRSLVGKVKSCGRDPSSEAFVKEQTHMALNSHIPYDPSHYVCDVKEERRKAPSHSEIAERASKKRAEFHMRNGMASSCGPDWSLNNVTHFNEISCTYQGVAMTDDGPMYDPTTTYTGRMASCDHSYAIGDDLMEDAQLYMYYKLDGESANLDWRKFKCRVASFPT